MLILFGVSPIDDLNELSALASLDTRLKMAPPLLTQPQGLALVPGGFWLRTNW